MIRSLFVLCGTLVLTAAVGAETPQYDDIKAALNSVSTAIDALSDDVDQAQDAAGIAQAFVQFGDTMRAFKKTMEELQAKYPELAADTSEPPPELLESLTGVQTSFAKLNAIMKKAEPYFTDPAVEDALQKMKESW